MKKLDLLCKPCVYFSCLEWVLLWMSHPRCLTHTSCLKTRPTVVPSKAFRCAMSIPSLYLKNRNFDGSNVLFNLDIVERYTKPCLSDSSCCRKLFTCFKKKCSSERVIPIGRPCPEKHPANVFNNQKYNSITFVPMVTWHLCSTFAWHFDQLFFLILGFDQPIQVLSRYVFPSHGAKSVRTWA